MCRVVYSAVEWRELEKSFGINSILILLRLSVVGFRFTANLRRSRKADHTHLEKRKLRIKSVSELNVHKLNLLRNW